MGILAHNLGVRALSLEDPAQPLTDPGALFESLGLGRSDAGVLVNETQAMRITTAQACVKIISEDLSSNAHEIFQDMPDCSVRRATDHRLWTLLHDEPNDHMTAKVFWGATTACAVGWGNGYAWIKRDNGARPLALIPLHPGKTSPVKIRGERMFATTQTDNGNTAFIDPANILHFPGLSFDGNVGLSPIRTCMNAFGLALAVEKFGAQFFGNSARASGIMTHPGVLNDEAYENIKKSIREMATGENALRPVILEEGMKWVSTSIPPNEAQFIMTRQYQRTEIAGLWRVPLHLVGDLTRATNNNIEHQSLDYVRYCLRPWAVGIEQEVNRKLLGGPFHMEHNFLDMLRGDFASQTAGFQILRGNGIYSANDCLRAMRQNAIPASEGGDLRIVQGAMIPLTSLLNRDANGDDYTTDSDAGDAQPFNRIRANWGGMFLRGVQTVVAQSVRGERFVRAVFGPIAESMMGQALAIRFGNCSLTNRERTFLDEQLTRIESASACWTRENVGASAAAQMYETSEAIRKEILL